ncbi:HutD family protein [Pseudoduganella ginsengisoli]|uniref:HutD family protein n=1 Tax=Pseudoduganella ginsengisoli TaxID=1462440 RepID=A0A6L6PU82_9BURK|nr:HutD family protein [Pseudoduganella ginsengisoli]MTW01083.1 HutD family protein [Pseudoduganella ginsengisoli]
MSKLIQYASLHATPWKNGGGSTTEIAIAPQGATFDDFDWRISLATISQSGPFSTFAGIDRTLTLVSGPGVVLDVGNERQVALSDREPTVAFPGEAQVAATVSSGSTTDFNVMTRRTACRHQLERRDVRDFSTLERRSDITIVFLAEGESLYLSSSKERIAMVRYDAVILDDEDVWTLEAGQATVFIVDIIENND